MVLEIRKIVLGYNGKIVELNIGKSHFLEELYTQVRLKKEGGGQRFTLDIHPKQAIQIDDLYIELSYSFEKANSIFCNGYQSWTESREYAVHEAIPNLRYLARPLMQYMGDYHFYPYPNKNGYLHSWTYTYMRLNKDAVCFLGSLEEKTGFTVFEHHVPDKKIYIRKDAKNLSLEHSWTAFDFWWNENTEIKTAFDTYFSLMNLPALRQKPSLGWTSWYYHYTKISENIILENLTAFQNTLQKIDTPPYEKPIFQIDDGYQTAVGDWLSIKPSFPNGMEHIATKIHQVGYKAGIWLAPFIVEKKSELYKTKPHWLLKDDKGKPLKIGYNPLWSGWFYALDFDQKEVQEYIRVVLLTVLEKWQYDMVKLDFLYAVCVRPAKNKTRGQIMWQAMDFLRSIVGNKIILACGVPLGAAFGQVDYCRIGADVHLKWEHRLLKWLRHRERVDTKLAIGNTVARYHLDGRAFWNDPDVFMLRKNKHQLSEAALNKLYIINVLLGNLLFTSDNTAHYDEYTISQFLSILLVKKNIRIHKIYPSKDLQKIHIEYIFENQEYLYTLEM